MYAILKAVWRWLLCQHSAELPIDGGWGLLRNHLTEALTRKNNIDIDWFLIILLGQLILLFLTLITKLLQHLRFLILFFSDDGQNKTNTFPTALNCHRGEKCCMNRQMVHKHPIGCFNIEDMSAASATNQCGVVLMRLNHGVIYDFILSLFRCDRINLQESRIRLCAGVWVMPWHVHSTLRQI